MKKWVHDQQAIVTDFKNRPMKLRQEATVTEMAQLNDIRTRLLEKQGILDEIEIKQMNMCPDMADTELRELVTNLEDEIAKLAYTRTVILQKIEEYRKSLQLVYSWYDTIIKQLERCDKLQQDSGHKSEEIQHLHKKFQEVRSKLDEFKDSAEEIVPYLSNLDVQQVKEQIRSAEKKHDDLQKRVGKKLHILEITHKGYEDAKHEINGLQNWVAQKIEYMKQLSHLGFKTRATESRLLEVNVSV